MNTIAQRLDGLRNLIQTPEFLDGKGLSNEVNIRIFCYDPKDEMAVRHFVSQAISDQSLGCHLIERNLFQVFINLCGNMDILDAIPEMEEADGSVFLLEQLHAAISDNDFVESMLYEPHERGDVLLLTGVGEVYPFMRVHALLDALQPYFSDIPILVMYPGVFDGSYVRLFDKMTPNPYYRAFNVV